IGGKQAVTAGVPVSGKAGIVGVIEYGYGHGLVADQATETAPAPARAPSGVAFFPLAGEISAVDAGVVQLSHRCGAAARVRVYLGPVGRNFESADDAKAQHAVFCVGERNFLIQSAERGDAVDAAESGPAAEDEVGMFVEERFFVEGYPVGFHVEFALLGPAF